MKPLRVDFNSKLSLKKSKTFLHSPRRKKNGFRDTGINILMTCFGMLTCVQPHRSHQEGKDTLHKLGNNFLGADQITKSTGRTQPMTTNEPKISVVK